MKCSGDTGYVKEIFKDIKVGVSDEEILDFNSENFDVIDSEVIEEQLQLQYGTEDSKETIIVFLPSGDHIRGSFRLIDKFSLKLTQNKRSQMWKSTWTLYSFIDKSY